MDLGSIDKRTRHIYDARRISSEFHEMTPDEVKQSYETKKELVASRWEACLKSYVMLFMMLNRGNRWPEDKFEICVAEEKADNVTYRTNVRVERDRKAGVYSARPFVDCGHGIIDYAPDSEYFGSEFTHKYGTQNARSAKFEATYDGGVKSEIRMTHIEGRKIKEMSTENMAIMMSAIDLTISPHLDNVEDTVSMLTNAVLDDKLNPELAKRARLPEH